MPTLSFGGGGIEDFSSTGAGGSGLATFGVSTGGVEEENENPVEDGFDSGAGGGVEGVGVEPKENPLAEGFGAGDWAGGVVGAEGAPNENPGEGANLAGAAREVDVDDPNPLNPPKEDFSSFFGSFKVPGGGAKDTGELIFGTEANVGGAARGGAESGELDRGAEEVKPRNEEGLLVVGEEAKENGDLSVAGA